ncbi:hypothetical protein AB0436_14465 [Streptomyces sp. NPDC051322]|uniref:hypothetical protein n=1 Tax=Streptomyces sp. NPDC051322 TaxID=3154645 RepID=UPI00344C07C2
MRAHDPDKTSDADQTRARASRATAVRPADVTTDVTAGRGGRSPLSLRALQRSIGNAAVSRLIEQDRHQHGAGCGHQQDAPAVQRAGDWKNKQTKGALKALKQQHPGDPLVHTLHHIAPKSKLAEFAAMLTATQRGDVVKALKPHAPTAFTTGSSSLQAVSDALKNLPANYAVGPEPGNRTDDPGAGIDPNYDREGAITPRSEELEQLNTLIAGLTSRPAGTPVSPAELHTFIAHAVAACQAHNSITGGGVGLDRDRVQWHGDPATRSSRRTGTLSPLA